ncbi:MAG: hypothetical protein R3B54_16020 [Bdellovibrionota bacterium]
MLRLHPLEPDAHAVVPKLQAELLDHFKLHLRAEESGEDFYLVLNRAEG